nr:hypothetical protein [Tanacetum cinerariifolium]
IMPPKSAPLTQAAIRRMIKESVNAAIATERARHADAGNDARGSRPVRGQDATLAIRECAFAGFMKCNPTTFHEGKKVKFVAVTLQGPALTWWNVKVATMGLETVNQMPWTERKQLITNNQNQGNARAMVTTPTDGKVSFGLLSLCERCFTRHVGSCTIKCHKCGKVGHKARYCKEKNVAMGANALPIPTCYDCGEQGHTRNQCPKKLKQEEVREVYCQAYAIKDAELQGPNVVTGAELGYSLHVGKGGSQFGDIRLWNGGRWYCSSRLQGYVVYSGTNLRQDGMFKP